MEVLPCMRGLALLNVSITFKSDIKLYFQLTFLITRIIISLARLNYNGAQCSGSRNFEMRSLKSDNISF